MSSKSAFSKYKTEKTTDKRQNNENLKRDKYETEIKKAKYEDDSMREEQQEEAKSDEDETMQTSNELNEDFKFIGVDTFNEAALLCDLNDFNDDQQQQVNRAESIVDLDENFIVLTLDTNEIFCFKGKISIKLIYGCVEINGYYIDSAQLKHRQRYFNLFSPDTHSHLSIVNKSIQQIGLDPVGDDDKAQIIALIFNELSNLNKNFKQNARIYDKLNSYLNENFNKKCKSIVILKKFKSKLCNYLTHFDNFKNMYQSSNLVSYIMSPNDIEFASMGVYPINSSTNKSIVALNTDDFNKLNEISIDIAGSNMPCIFACGGKDTGKSTYLRYLVNYLLNTNEYVAYLDCDPGQCEFTLSGCLQLTLINEPLLGPPHTHLVHYQNDSTEVNINEFTDNSKCYFFGSLSPNDTPGQYLDCIRKLYSHYEKLVASINQARSSGENRKSSKIPLIVNTMGWNQGLGLCLLKEQIRILKPTHIIQLNCSDANKNLPTIDYDWYMMASGWPPTKPTNDDTLPNYRLINVVRQSSDIQLKIQQILCDRLQDSPDILINNKRNKQTYSAKDHRTIAVIAYFSALYENQIYFKAIHHVKPYRVPWSRFAVHVAHIKVAYEQIFYALNASLVGLCRIDEKYIKRPDFDSQLPGYLDLNSNENLNNYDLSSFKCYGFGIIRGINMETKEFYILTVESVEKLDQVNLLVKGMLNLPVEFFYEQDSATPTPYVTYVDSLNEKNNSNSKPTTQPIQRKYLVHQSNGALSNEASEIKNSKK